MKKQNLILSVLAILVFIVVAMNISTVTDEKTKQKEPNVIHIGYRPISTSLDLFVAIEMGYFKDEGLEVKLHNFRGSSDLTNAVINGKVDVASQLGMVTQLLPQMRSHKPMSKFIGFTSDAINSPMRGPVLVAKKDSDIKTIADLKGKTIGIFPGANFKIFLEAALRAHGISLEEVSILPIAPTEQATSLQSVDALLSLDPIISGLEHKAGAIVIADRLAARYIYDDFLTSATSLNIQFAEQNPNSVEKVERALNKAVDYIRNNPNQTYEILAKYTGLPLKVVETMKPVKYLKLDEVSTMDMEKSLTYLQSVEWLNIEKTKLKGEDLLN